MKPKVLWIEDGALVEVSHYVGPIFTSGKFDLMIALNASDGVQKLLQTEFDAVIVDIRIDPGNDSEWIKLYYQYGSNKITARLGIHLLESFLRPLEAKVKLEKIPEWISPERFGILTVESNREVEEDLKKLSIQFFRQKTIEIPVTVLLDLSEKIVSSRKNPI